MTAVLLAAFVAVLGARAAAWQQSGPPPAPPVPTAQDAAPAAQRSPEYKVGPRDVLVVTLWDQPDLSGRYRIAADGTFTFPLVGRIPAAGLTLGEVEKRLRQELANGFFTDPQMAVSVEEYGSQQFFVVGEVRQPGAVALSRRMTLMEALVRAGSTTPDASGEVIILRPRAEAAQTDGPVQPDQADVTEVLRIDLRDLQSGAGANVVVQNGDTVFVPRAETLFVLGHVRNPGAYPFKKGTTVLQALSLAGGVTDRGAMGRVKIVRIVAGQKQEIKVKPTDEVKPGDTIVVPEKYF